MRECKVCRTLCDLIKMLLDKDSVSVEEVDTAIEAAERLLKVLKTYKEAC